VQVDDEGPAARAKLLRVDGERLVIAHEQSEFVATVVAWGEARHVFAGGHERRFDRVDPLAHAGEHETPEGHLRAPMSGTIIAVMVKDGDRVARGAALIVLEAMKMEHTIVAPADGVVSAVRFRQGDRVQEGADLVELDIVEAVATS
jgi:3-methylcrotonyl-CoA carboxylase alpha subunit